MINTVLKIHRQTDSTSPLGIVFEKCYDPYAGNKYKSNRYICDLKDFPIKTNTKFQRARRELLHEKEFNFHTLLSIQ